VYVTCAVLISHSDDYSRQDDILERTHPPRRDVFNGRPSPPREKTATAVRIPKPVEANKTETSSKEQDPTTKSSIL
jgi:hypothetical protein